MSLRGKGKLGFLMEVVGEKWTRRPTIPVIHGKEGDKKRKSSTKEAR